ncbi:MAG: ABC transporter permease [Clostridiales bacterium]|nr:ABC transporter permease [Clostridiales bacterium]
MKRTEWMKVLGAVVVVLLYTFLLAPIAVVVVAAFNAGEFLHFPPEGFSLRWFVKFGQSSVFVKAFLFSLRLALIVSLTATVIGTLAALYVVHRRGRFSGPVQLSMISPLAMPQILSALALLLFAYAIGLGTRNGVALFIGHLIVTVPFVFIIVSGVLYGFDRNLEEASRGLGATPWKTFWRVTFPLIRGGVISGALFAFIVSFDQFPMNLLLAGVGINTLPVHMFDYLRFSFDPTIAAVSTINIAMTLVLVLLMERLVGLESLQWSRK